VGLVRCERVVRARRCFGLVFVDDDALDLGLLLLLRCL
jgi:hypothetical protein